MMGSERRRTPQRAWKRKFLEELRRGSTVTHSAGVAGVGRTTVYELREADPDFAKAWDDAYEAGADRIEQEAYRRAVDGVPGRPVTFRGEVVSEVTEYSDTLMLALLKARKPDQYRERPAEVTTGDTYVLVNGATAGEVAAIPPGAQVLETRAPWERGEVIDGEVVADEGGPEDPPRLPSPPG